MKSRLLMNSCAGLALFFAVGGVASAADLPTKAPAEAPPAADDSLTWNGITLYGIIDVGVSNQTDGTPLSSKFYTGVQELVQKNGTRSITGFTPDGLSQSQIGLKGDIPMGGSGFSAIFNFNAGFLPNSLELGDAVGSLVQNNGKNQFPYSGQNSNGDGSRAGQIFNGAAYAGVKSNTYGTLTYGRQNSVMLDDVLKYDPQGGSYAFALIGYSGAAPGMGDTQDARLDSSLKYTNKIGWLRVGALYQWGGQQNEFIGLPDGVSGKAYEADVGVDIGGFSADLIYNYKQDAIGAAPLSAAQVLLEPNPRSVAGTVSNNTSLGAMAKYTAGPATWYGGFEQITFANPTLGFSPTGSPYFGLPSTDIGGYNLFYTSASTDPFGQHKVLDYYWAGLKYFVTPKLSLTGAFYYLTQNSYNFSGVNTPTPCSNNSSSKCSGQEQVVSFVADYFYSKHLDFYIGAMWSEVHNGLANGFVHNSDLSTMAGARYTF
jgi:predicted porin